MKLRRILALSFVCALLCSTLPLHISAAAEPRPLKNGSFDSGNADAWTALDGVSVVAEAAYEGDYGCLLTGDGGWDNLLYQTFTVLPGYSYTLRFWYKAMPMGVSWYLLDGGESGARLHRGWAGNSEWTCVTQDFVATSDAVCLLFRCSGSNVAEYVYLDSVEVTIHPCTTHIYDHACDTDCNACGEIRTVGDHLYDHACDTVCNHCGFEREPSGEHTYDYPCATQCNYCGALRESEGEHTYDDVCDVDCAFCGEVREVEHIYDDIYDADCNHCGHVRIPTPKPMNRLFGGGASASYDANGVAFRFFIDAENGIENADHLYVKNSATVYPFNNGVAYKLIRMGAVMSNEKDPIMDLDHLTARTIDIKANYLCRSTADQLSYAVRIINIPADGRNTTISARPYFVYSDGKTEIVVYGETVTQTFNALTQGI